jgi:hypothetical protein
VLNTGSTRREVRASACTRREKMLATVMLVLLLLALGGAGVLVLLM